MPPPTTDSPHVATRSPSGRIVEIAKENMTAEQLAAYHKVVSGPRGRLPTPYKIWLHSPKLAHAMDDIGTYLAQASSLTKREAEIAVLAIARHFDADYVFQVHARAAQDAGLSRGVIRAIADKTAPPLTDPREQAVFRVTAALCDAPHVADEVFDEADKILRQNGIADVLALLGYFASVAFVAKFYAVPPPSAPNNRTRQIEDASAVP